MEAQQSAGKAVVYADYDRSGERVIRVSRVLPDGKLDVYTTYYLSGTAGDKAERAFSSLFSIVLDMIARGWEVESRL